ncbi:MAG: hypothetical protein GY830_03025 [Bacteroidetes bacterium]|nr:hypothetical protein [Bacteroidota bacterium]
MLNSRQKLEIDINKTSFKKQANIIRNYKRCFTIGVFIYIVAIFYFFHDKLELLFNKYNLKRYSFDNILNNDLNITIDQLGNAGFGNTLNTYWHYRAYAYWNNLNFNLIDKNKNSISNIRESEHKRFLSFLPKYSKLIPDYNFRILMNKEKINLRSYPFWQNCEQLTFFNKPMIDIISKETHQILNNFFMSSNTTKIEYKISPCDIAIHFRCGDILLIEHESYYFMTFKYYINSINKILKKGNKLNCLSLPKKDYPKKIWLISQISSNGTHTSIEENSISFCEYIAFNIKSKLQNYYKSYSVDIVNNDIINDYNLMVKVPFLICDTSTFCFNPAIANIHKNIVIPIKGPWDINKIIGTELIPDSFLFIDGIKNKWQLSSTEITKRNWNNNIEELIHFILNN